MIFFLILNYIKLVFIKTGYKKIIMKKEEVSVEIYLNDEYLIKKKTYLNISLSELRKILNNIISENYYFIHNDKKIEEEKKRLIEDIIKDNKIYIKSFSVISIILNDNQIDKIMISKTKKLSEIRKLIKINNFNFILKQDKMDILKEDELLISNILENDKIYIEEENKLKIYKLNIDNKLYVNKYFSNQTLDNIRNDLDNLINKNYHFYIDDKIIEIEDENKIKINNLSNIIYIKKDKILKNKAIEGSILLSKQKNLKQLYLYPNINEIDDINSLSILLI